MSQKYVTSKRTGQLGMSLITIIKTTAGIIEFNKSKSDLKEHLTEHQKGVENLDEQRRGS